MAIAPMIRCYEGHFICSAKRFVELEREHGWIADIYCKACDDYVPADTKANLRAAGYVKMYP